MIILFAAFACAVLSAFFGARSLSARTGTAYTAETNHASPNYYYLSDPQMLTADANNVYVVNCDAVNGDELLVLNTTGALAVEKVPLPAACNPIFIKYAGNRVFLFEANGFRVFLNNTFQTKVNFGTAYNFFDVCQVSSTTYRVFFATDTSYGWNDYVLSGTAFNPTPQPSSQALAAFKQYHEIAAISCDGANKLFVYAHDTIYGDQDYYFYNVSIPQVPIYYLRDSIITSFCVIPNSNKFVYIDHDHITMFDKDSAKQPFVEYHGDRNKFDPKKSFAPIFAAAANSNHVYIIDEEKHSIDRYFVNGSELQFDKIIVAHRGGDNGFFDRPTSLSLVNTSLRKQTNEMSSEYLVTDRAGQIMYNEIDKDDGKTTCTQFFTDPDMRLSDNARAAFDSFDTVYIYDRDSVQNTSRIRTFTLDGKQKELELTGGFEYITYMFTDTNRTIYALDLFKNSIFYYAPTENMMQMELLPAFEKMKSDFPSYKLTLTSQAIYSEKLDAIIISTVQISAGVTRTVILPLKDETAQAIDLGDVVGITASGYDENIFIITRVGALYIISIYDDLTDSPEHTETITAATVNQNNPSFAYDSFNRRILYIGTRHAIESFKLGNGDILSPAEHIHDTSWKTPAPFEHTDTIFKRAEKDVVIYQYPATRALALAPKGSVFKVLNDTQNYVLYENPSTGECIKGYVSQKPEFVSDTPPYAAPEFERARVMLNYTKIYKYPTTAEQLTLLTIAKNFNYPLSDSGLKLENKITAGDFRGYDFYEIRLDDAGGGKYVPDRYGNFVGYIKGEGNVIDYDLAPSTENFVTNASIRIPTAQGIDSVEVYDRTSSGTFTLIEHETLANKHPVFIISTFGDYTYIRYFDAAIDRTREGWVRSAYVIPDGLSAIQLVAIAVLALLAVGGVTMLVVRIKKKRT